MLDDGEVAGLVQFRHALAHVWTDEDRGVLTGTGADRTWLSPALAYPSEHAG